MISVWVNIFFTLQTAFQSYVCPSYFQFNNLVTFIVYDSYLQISRSVHIIFFMFLHENMFCGYSLEVPQ